jgi:hypothetical protein|tara:strand:- start:82 stop:240 length:159 start_codon:yes stop_codon:yes gene_type:complete
MTNDPLTIDELYILTDAVINYKYGWVDKSLNPSTKYKIRIIQKKLLLMEENS